jgi:thiol-disulfide isomerase/thioredoxin
VTSSASPGRAARFPARIGAALLAPRQALASAAGSDGRCSRDAVLLIALAFAVSRLPRLVTAGWLAVAGEPSAALIGVTGLLSSAVTPDLAVLAVLIALVFVGAGRRRMLHRDVELGAVAFVPYLVSRTTCDALLALASVTPGPRLAGLVSAGGALWALALVVLALRLLRSGAAADASLAPRPRWRAAGWVVLGALAGMAALQAAYILRHRAELAPVHRGQLAPTWSLPTIAAQGRPGPAIALESLRGQVVVLDFWATWCAPCRDALPALERLQARHRGRGLTVLGINIEGAGAAAAARAMADRLGVSYPLLADAGEVADRYQVTTIPHLVLIDRHGVVRGVFHGTGDLAEPLELVLARPR